MPPLMGACPLWEILDLPLLRAKIYGYHAKIYIICTKIYQGGGSELGLTHDSWFNSCHGLFSPLTPIINTNTLSLKHLMSILLTFNLKIHFNM